MAKLHLVYKDRDDQLLFNAVGIPLGRDDLSFVEAPDEGEASGESVREQTEAAAEFARLVNRIPEAGRVWQPTDRLVWDEVQRALDPSQTRTASIDLSEDQKNNLQKAERLLYGDDREPGSVSEKYEAYKTYQSRYHEKKTAYNSAQIDAQYATGEEKARARQRASALKEELDAAMEEWKTRGYKAEIEHALDVTSAIRGRMPHRRRSEARQKVDFKTSRYERTSVASGTSFLSTRYVPADVHRVESDSWTSFTLSKDQIDEISRKAREDFSDLEDERLFAGGLDLADDVSVEEVSFEMTRAEIVRPWFNPAILEARDWMWRSDQKPLSDGGDPPSGTMPVYVSSMILARDVSVTFADEASARAAGEAVREQGALSVGPLVLDVTPQALQTERTLTGMKLNATAQPTLQHLSTLSPQTLSTTVGESDGPTGDPDSGSGSGSNSGSGGDSGTGPATVHPVEATLAQPLVTVQPDPSSESDSALDSGYRGRVAEKAGGASIDGAQITFDQRDGSTTKTVTSSNGRYSVRLPKGKYKVTARHPRYEPYSTQGYFVVTGSEMQTGNIFMGEPTGEAGESSGSSGESDAGSSGNAPEAERIRTIQVLAFGCTELGKAPNPDPVLDFSG